MSDPVVIASRYRVVRELGRGGMGVVYVVEHARTGDQLALKLLHGRAAQDPSSIERFKREARASARIKSEHVVKVVDADVAPELENAPFLVMELLNGNDLQKQVERGGRMPPDQVVHYLSQAARALDKSHSIGIIHRDLKPENLFVHTREDGSTVLKILDFGISKIIGGEGSADMTGAGMTSTGSVMGTPLYMAPEQARGRVTEIAPPTDIWAVGLIALYLLTGEIYWRANTIAELMSQILAEPMYRPTERWAWLPRGIDDWFARSCARDSKQRFQSVGAQIQALAGALGVASAPSTARQDAPSAFNVVGAGSGPHLPGAGTTGATAADPGGATTRASRGPLFAGAALVVLLAGAGSTAWVIKGRAAASRAEADPAPAASSVAPPVVAPPPTETPPPPAAAVSSVPVTPPVVAPAPAPVKAAPTPAPVAPAAPPAHRNNPAGPAPAATRTQPSPPPPQPSPSSTRPPSPAFNPAAP